MKSLYIIKQDVERYGDVTNLPDEIKVITTEEKALTLARVLNSYAGFDALFYVEGI